MVYILPVLVVLPMGGGGTRMRESRCHTDNTSQSEKQMVGKGLKKRARSRPNGDENDDSPGNKKPRKVGRPQNFANHVCKDCTIWSQSGSHPNLQAYHLCNQMRHPGPKYQAVSNYASYGGITIALYPDSCICQQCYTDYQRKPSIPRWYKKYEEVITETGEELGIGAEVETYGEIEDDCQGHGKHPQFHHMSPENTDSDDTDDMDNDETQDSDETDERSIIMDQQMKLVIDNAILKLVKEGCIYSKDFIPMISVPSAKTLSLFYRELENISKSKGYKCYSTNRRLGKLIYDPSKFSEHAVTYTYKLHVSKWKLHKQNTNTINEEKIRKLIKKQCSTLPHAHTYDYRSLINTNGMLEDKELDRHFNTDLCEFVEKITSSDISQYRASSKSYKNLRKLRIRMIICMLCMAMNPANSFFQTMLGVIAYMFGLRDRGFDILNAFGIICSVDQVRKHGTFWSKKRCVTDELKRNTFWRVSFDNLNFKMKFAKCLGVAMDGVKKMLNLITAQVSTRRANTEGHNHNKQCVPTLGCLVKDTIKWELLHIQPIIPQKLTLGNLCSIDDGNSILNFCKISYVCTIDRISTNPLNCSETFFLSLSKYLPHYTPTNGGDEFTFATIKEGQTATPDDVEAYLHQLKGDLKIGSEGFPNKIMLAGDEQTFSILISLKEQKGETFEWLYPIPGDWHLLKLTAEVLRDIMWDGGLKEFAIKCGYKANNIISQWQDINLLLLATFEALMRKATTEYILAVY